MALTDEKYMAFTTYRKNGDAVSIPTWLTPVSDGRIGFWTAMGTGKTKRLRNNPQVAVQPSDVRGRVKEGTAPRSGSAEMVQSGRLFDEVKASINAKYGFMPKITKLLAKLGPQGRKGLTYADTVVLVTLED
jgi:PPOX class probable F420-dependent enzyme